MTVSIIVAVKENNPCLRECIESCLKLDYPDFEILILPDKEINLDYPKTKIIPTGAVTPPQKRDIAIYKARGEILAFLDDDTYPDNRWLTAAVKHFSDPAIAAVGGPAITPDSDTLRQKASGLVYSSWLMSGPYVNRYLPKVKQFVDDFPSCNFLIQKTVIQQIGGFNTKFWPGEDTFLCLKIVKDLKKKIIYDPDVLVYHHRRNLFAGHLRQIANYGLHRGYFAKRFPENSLKASYFLPSLFVLGIISGMLVAVYSPQLRLLYLYGWVTYLLLVAISSLNKDFRLTLLVFWGIILSHIVYGLYFIKGLFSRKLREE